MTSPRSTAPDECAQCGAAIPPGARACPECGADEQTGWCEQSVYDGLDLPDDSPGAPFPPSRRALPWHWTIVAILALALLLFGILSFR